MSTNKIKYSEEMMADLPLKCQALVKKDKNISKKVSPNLK